MDMLLRLLNGIDEEQEEQWERGERGRRPSGYHIRDRGQPAESLS
jgi:hypothetical protein